MLVIPAEKCKVSLLTAVLKVFQKNVKSFFRSFGYLKDAVTEYFL